MKGFKRWLSTPLLTRSRRIVLQVHLWLGLVAGLYFLVVCLSGSAIVLRPQIHRWFIPVFVADTALDALSPVTLQQQILASYAPAQVLDVVESANPARAVFVRLLINNEEEGRYFDQYTGRDIGSANPWQVKSVEWLTLLHNELLLGPAGLKLNGVGGLLLLLMVCSGLLLWWQGTQRWYKGLYLSRRRPQGLLWQLHSVLGFWLIPLLFIWGSTAVYFAWSAPFEYLVDLFDSNPDDFERPDAWITNMVALHFGRFRGVLWAQILWILLGLFPVFFLITGVLLWYRREFSGARRREFRQNK